ncbi:MAG: hypothetical protein D3913_15185, partial [Candidatus Electrothrix sp. LOE1_4_5]|nr:hypothetical protein [Candidatus Electrothrix gigas]
MNIRTKKILAFTAVSLLIGITVQASAADRKVVVTEQSFECLHQNQKVRNMYVDKIIGNLKGTLAVAGLAPLSRLTIASPGINCSTVP